MRIPAVYTAGRFKEELAKQTGLDVNQAADVNDIIEDTSILGNANKEKIISGIVEKLGVSEEQADQIYNTAMGIIKDAVVDRINPFKK